VRSISEKRKWPNIHRIFNGRDLIVYFINSVQSEMVDRILSDIDSDIGHNVSFSISYSFLIEIQTSVSSLKKLMKDGARICLIVRF